MKISVASAVHGQTGTTTVALFASHALALTQKKNICLTHADFGSTVLFSAVGIEAEADMTRSLSHVTMMLKNNMLQPGELPDYAINLFTGLDMYSTHKLTLDIDDLLSFYGFLLNKLSIYDHTIVDVDAGFTSEISRLALSVSDIILIPVNHNYSVLEESKKFKVNLENMLANERKRRNTRILYVLNHYNPSISSYKRVAGILNVKATDILTLHYSPYFVKTFNQGKISDYLRDALLGKGRVLSLRNDMKGLCKTLLGKEFLWEMKKGAR